MAAKRLVEHGNQIEQIGSREGEVEGNKISTSKLSLQNIDTVTLYINPTIQKQYYDYILSLKPKRIIFNPGTENMELQELAKQNNIETIEACTLVMLSVGNF